MKPSNTNGATTHCCDDETWGPQNYGAELIVNGPTPAFTEAPFAVDVETDEHDGFVGIALCQSKERVYYYTHLGPVIDLLENGQLVGHNLKGDIQWLKQWGVKVSEANLFYDTMIASYVIHATRDSHGLKPLAKQLLGLLWPSYNDMTHVSTGGKRARKITLDKLPVKAVARYCGMDCLSTLKLSAHFTGKMSGEQRRVFNQMEMPINRLLFKMQQRGVAINLNYLSELDSEFAQKIAEILSTVKNLTETDIAALLTTYKLELLKEKWEQSGYKAFSKKPVLNPGSWQQKRLLLKFLGIVVDSTDKKTLWKYRDKTKLIDVLLQHSQFAKLYDGFICAFKELPTLPIIHTTFNQVSEDSDDEDDMRGLRTGRLSSSGPNLMQIPARTEEGRKLRNLFVPRGGRTFVVADYSQIELRVAAHFSHDPVLVRAFKSGEDVHDATAKALGVERFYGKTGNFLLAFGGFYKRLMDSLSIDEKAAKDFYEQYWQTFKILKLWKERAVELARARGGVRTLFGRWIPVKDLDSPSFWIRGKAERFAISGIVQGSAADIIKLAMLECDKKGYSPVLTVHDELVFEVPDVLFGDRDSVDLQIDIDEIELTMENVVKLDVPLEVVIGHGQSWGSAKH